MASDAFVVGEDFISEHYFTTEPTKQSLQSRVNARRKDWDEREAAGEKTPRSRVAAVRGELTSALSALAAGDDEDTGVEHTVDLVAHRERVLEPLARALGYEDSRWRRTVDGPVTLLASADSPETPTAALLFAKPVSDVADLLSKKTASLIEPFDPEGEPHPVESVAKTLSWLFAGEDTPAYAVVLAGSQALLVERERWAEGRYLAVDVQLVLDRNDVKKRGGEFDRAVALLAAESIMPGPDGTVWWTESLDDAVKHTVGVSKDLRDGVRESIEIIANEVVDRRRAAGLDPLPNDQAQLLARQSLRYLYRVLFLLFAEASPELEVLPVRAPEYGLGYGLDRLRELVLVQLGADSRDRTHLHSSLERLFRLVDAGHDAKSGTAARDDAADVTEGLTFHPLNADLFAAAATSLIDEVGLGDGALQRVLSLLLLTKEQRTKKGSDRGFISYADLGINQLGAVYEGLMSYTGFFADTDLYEVAKDGDSSKGSWVVPVDRADDISKKDFVMVEDPFQPGLMVRRRYSNGQFVFRLSGRERQTSASYYSPEVLTKFVVGQALEELLDQDGHVTTAEEILSLSVCEPALGSGAFAIEAVRQLADEYLSRREKEVGERIDPDQRPRELQKAKAAIALHQVYGVDLNATAVELAEISLWLDTMVDGLQAPWFGMRLRRGNSLIGARRAVYSAAQIDDKAWLKDVPTDVAVSGLVDEMRDGRIATETSGKVHHFLLPADGWGAAIDAKEGKELAPEAHARLRAWRNEMRKKPSKKQVAQLQGLAHRVETLWQFTLRRLEIAETQVAREVSLWNDPREAQAAGRAVSRDEVEKFLRSPEGAYQRLRRVMDAWCAMWFWPLTDSLIGDATPPTLDEWIAGLTALLGTHVEVKGPKKASEGARTLGLPGTWAELSASEGFELTLAQVMPINVAIEEHPWLAATQRLAEANGFFHWELDFASVFARGGFDLQVGNPPWVRPRSDVSALLAEGDPWWQLTTKPPQSSVREKRRETLLIPEVRAIVVDGVSSTSSNAAYLGSSSNYPRLAGLQPDLYRCFMELTWRHQRAQGMISLIHPETHFTDERGGALRRDVYRRLRRHWQFVNALLLFEIKDNKRYGVHVYGRATESPDFLHASKLYHPTMVERSLAHTGFGPVPGERDDLDKWDLTPHRDRISRITINDLIAWRDASGEISRDPLTSKLPFVAGSTAAAIFRDLLLAPRMGEHCPEYSAGWVEGRDNTPGGILENGWVQPRSLRDSVLQGPFFHVNRPFYRGPNPTLKHNQDTFDYDLAGLAVSEVPRSAFSSTVTADAFDAAYDRRDDGTPFSKLPRVAWRVMADNAGRRTLMAGAIPPGPTHVDGVLSATFASDRVTILACAYMSSMLCDFLVRSEPKSTIRGGVINRLPLAIGNQSIDDAIVARTMRLNFMTVDYGKWWAELATANVVASGRPVVDRGRGASAPMLGAWSEGSPLRIDAARYQAQVELDVLIAMELGISADSLINIYRTQFGVQRKYDRAQGYDANGRLVPNEVLKVWKQKGDDISEEERTAVHPGSGIAYEYVLPFVTLDREADMRQAYAHFEKILEERS